MSRQEGAVIMTGERSEYTGREIVAEMPAADVFTSDHEKLGQVAEIGPEWVIVERRGLFSGGSYWIPASRVSGDPESGSVYVDVSRDEIDQMGWDQEPDLSSSSDPQSYRSEWQSDARNYETATLDRDTTTTQDDQYAERIRVHAEELEARKVAKEAGAVRVSKDVVEEQREIEVPVTREEVKVSRRAVSGDASADASAFQDSDTIRVPVFGETVEVRKVPRVVEEVGISKHAVQSTEQVTDTVRREKVRVEDEGNVTIAGDPRTNRSRSDTRKRSSAD
jgi:uncharacterized protein (TIGR02271 family)